MATVLYDITAEMLLAAGYRLIFAGDDYDYTFTVMENGVLLTLDSADIWFTIKKCPSDPDAQAKLSYTTPDEIEIDDTPGVVGKFVVHFVGTDTLRLPGSWYYDCKAKLNTGRMKHIAYGKIEFLNTVTRALEMPTPAP